MLNADGQQLMQWTRVASAEAPDAGSVNFLFHTTHVQQQLGHTELCLTLKRTDMKPEIQPSVGFMMCHSAVSHFLVTANQCMIFCHIMQRLSPAMHRLHCNANCQSFSDGFLQKVELQIRRKMEAHGMLHLCH